VTLCPHTGAQKYVQRYENSDATNYKMYTQHNHYEVSAHVEKLAAVLQSCAVLMLDCSSVAEDWISIFGIQNLNDTK
jgi:hypothetical protein